MKINYKSLLLNIIIPVLLGSLVGFITSPSNSYSELIQPSFAPPGILFPIIWTILYTLMGISHYLVTNSDQDILSKSRASFIYIIQLIVNLLWSIVFFSFGWRLFAFIWIILLIILVIIMIKRFYDINKTAAYLQIPYLAWLIFASILNLSVYLLNR